MRIRIRHHMSYIWRTPAKSIIQIMRLTPRNHEGQRVGSWYTDINVDHALRVSEDAYGNHVHTISIDGPLSKLNVTVEGDVETFDTAGVLRDAIERFPTIFYLRSTPDTETSGALRDFASEATATATDALGRMHALMGAISDRIECTKGAPSAAATAFEKQSGTGADLAQIFIAGARHIGVPARFVSGYYFNPEAGVHADAHGWAEAFIEGLGWVGFDPANCICPTESHVSVARALDYIGAAPVRASRSGGEGEDMTSQVRVSQQQDQRQS